LVIHSSNKLQETKEKFVSWMRSAMSSTKSINLLLYIYSITR
jgi:hypothetical protein